MNILPYLVEKQKLKILSYIIRYLKIIFTLSFLFFSNNDKYWRKR